MAFPMLDDPKRIARMNLPPGRLRFVLDTDAYNETDDQFAIVHALRSPERLEVEALYAAPFHNERSTGPADGMEKSYEELIRLLERLQVDPEGLALRGSTQWMTRSDEPVDSPAARDLVARAMRDDDRPLIVAAIGAVTNVASAILIEPRIIDRITVIWLAGQPMHWHTARDFNLQQDIHASRVIFDSGVPLIHIPCHGVASHLLTSKPELETHLRGAGRVADYLADVFAEWSAEHDNPLTKEIWDIAATGYAIEPTWTRTALVPSPMLTDQLTWSHDPARHLIRTAIHLRRDHFFADLYQKVTDMVSS